MDEPFILYNAHEFEDVDQLLVLHNILSSLASEDGDIDEVVALKEIGVSFVSAKMKLCAWKDSHGISYILAVKNPKVEEALNQLKPKNQ